MIGAPAHAVGQGEGTYTLRALLKLSRFLKPYRLWAVLAPLAMVLEVALDLMQPRMIQRIIDAGITRGNFDLVLHTGLWMIALAILGVGAGMACTVFAMRAGQGFGADLRRALFAKVQSLSFANLDTLETGTLITRLTNDVTQVQEVVLMLLRVMVRVPLLLIGSLIMAILTSPRLALLFLPLLPFVATVLILIINRAYPLYGEVQRRLDALNTVLRENLAGVRVVKAFARGEHETGRFAGANDRLMIGNVAAARLGATTLPLMMAALNAGVVAALWIGGVHVAGGDLEVGRVIAFVNYLTQTLMAIMAVSMLIVRLSRAEASGQRIAEVLASRPEIERAPDALRPRAPRGRVAFENVCFNYPGDAADDPVLKDVSFVAEPGQTIAILGATGAGKSSLVHLIPRFYDVTGGRITLDGEDVRALDLNALRGAVGVALQESILFSGTIRDNIRYGRPDASDDEVVAAARAAQADDFIRRLPGAGGPSPDGYDTVVGQRGVNLSGGQKQRIAIARALLINPAVLILDDSTSAVDVRTEAEIQRALSREHAGQTRFVVAQRISSVIGADQILVLDDGHLVARGTHEQLLASSPIYREIYESQQEQGRMAHDGAV